MIDGKKADAGVGARRGVSSVDGDVEDFLRSMRAGRGLSQNTVLSYGFDLRSFFRFLRERHLDARTVDAAALSDYFWSRRSAGLKPASLYRSIETLKQFYRFLLAEGRIGRDPSRDIVPPRIPRRVPRSLSSQDGERLLNFPAEKNDSSLRFKAMLELLATSGLRVSPLMVLEESQWDPEAGGVRVAGPGGRECLVPVSRRAVEAVRAYLEKKKIRFPTGTRALFVNSRGQPLTRAAFWRQLKVWAKRAGLERSISPCAVFPVFADHFFEKSMDSRAMPERGAGHHEPLKECHRRFHPRG